MAYTASQVLKAALQRILVQGSEATLEADEYADAMLALNAMMAAWVAEGIELGYTDVDDLSDTITVPQGAIRGIIANLAIEMAPDFNGKISAALAAQANEGLKAIRLLAVQRIPTHYPGNLPRGGGVDTYFYDDAYFPGIDISQYYDHQFKDPDGVIPVTVDWSDLMTQTSDTISSASWVTDGLTVDSSSNTTLTASAVVSGGNADSVYILTSRVVTTGGKTYDRSVAITVREN